MITRDGIRSAALPRRSTINALARNVYEGLATPMPQGPAARRRHAAIDELSATIIGSVSGELGQYQRIVVAADGALQYVPFSVLSVDGHGTLNESHDIIVIPSLTAVARQHEIRKEQAAPSKTLAIIGDPVFDESDPRLYATATNKGPAIQGALPGTRLTTLSRLPFSGHEVDQIASLVVENERLVATGFEATKARVAGANLQDYRYVHFATHGIIDSSQPALSTLVLSMHDINGTAADGYFRLRDIYDLELNADVVVLSACDTALGRQVRGEGLIGMTQGFLYAGAAQIVASLWQVPDRATAELMTLFYKRLLEDHQSPVSALRGAQRDLAQRSLWRDPYFWSGFVVQGDWR
jgi:CHAT domain-containing protein